MGLPYFEMEFSARFLKSEIELSALFPRITATTFELTLFHFRNAEIDFKVVEIAVIGQNSL